MFDPNEQSRPKVLTEEFLEQWEAKYMPPPKPASNGQVIPLRRAAGTFSPDEITALLTHHNLLVKPGEPYKNGQWIWPLPECFKCGHSDHNVVIILDKDGSPHYHCSHDSCRGTVHWPDFVRAYPLLPSPHTPGEEGDEKDSRVIYNELGGRIFRSLSMAETKRLPEQHYILEKILQAEAVSLLYGESTAGKTFVALAWALSIAYGRPWLGHKVEQGQVLYIYAEGILGLKKRIMAFQSYYNLEDTEAIRFIKVSVDIINDHDLLMNTILAQDMPVSLVVIDTFSNCTPGINQSNQDEVARVMVSCHKIKEDAAAHVLLVHHTNKSGGFNGSMAFKNHTDTMIEAVREEEKGPTTLIIRKHRDDETPKPFALNWKVIGNAGELGCSEQTGDPITSCVLIASEEWAPQPQVDRFMAQMKMVDILRKLERASFNQWYEECTKANVNIARQTFTDYVKTLVLQGDVKRSPTGQGKATYYELAQELTTSSEQSTG